MQALPEQGAWGNKERHSMNDVGKFLPPSPRLSKAFVLLPVETKRTRLILRDSLPKLGVSQNHTRPFSGGFSKSLLKENPIQFSMNIV